MQQLPLPGDFFVSRSNSGAFVKRALPALVRYITDSDWNHAGIYIGGSTVVEAQPGGVRFWALADYLGPDTVWSTGKLFPWSSATSEVAGRARIVEAAKGYLGTPYGLLDCVALGLAQSRLGSRADVKVALAEQPWWVRRLMSPKTLICSQLVDQVYLDAGIHLFNDGRLPDWVSPGDLGRLLGV